MFLPQYLNDLEGFRKNAKYCKKCKMFVSLSQVGRKKGQEEA